MYIYMYIYVCVSVFNNVFKLLLCRYKCICVSIYLCLCTHIFFTYCMLYIYSVFCTHMSKFVYNYIDI